MARKGACVDARTLGISRGVGWSEGSRPAGRTGGHREIRLARPSKPLHEFLIDFSDSPCALSTPLTVSKPSSSKDERDAAREEAPECSIPFPRSLPSAASSLAFMVLPAVDPLASARMLCSYALSGMVVSLAGLGDFPGQLRVRHPRPLPIANLPGGKARQRRALAALRAAAFHPRTASARLKSRQGHSCSTLSGPF